MWYRGGWRCRGLRMWYGEGVWCRGLRGCGIGEGGGVG